MNIGKRLTPFLSVVLFLLLVRAFMVKMKNPASIKNPQDNKITRQPYTNRLVKEKSPYLLQHAYNPVDWYPWGTEAFVKAKKEDKPIFLSIGYSSCHWCHVMEEESFS